MAPELSRVSDSSNKLASAGDPTFRDIGQVGSLTGAVHLLNNNAGVLRGAQCEQKSHVAHQGKSSLDFSIFSTNPSRESEA